MTGWVNRDKNNSLAAKNAGYEIVDPQTASRTPLTAANADNFLLQGYCFYPCLPNQSINLKTFLIFAFKGRKADIKQLFSQQLFMSLLGLLIPIATGVLLNTVIPNAETSLLSQWIIMLTTSIFAVALFNAAQLLTLIRIKFKMNAYAQAAVWDRLLRLPINFFQQFSPGDLGVRMEGIDRIQQELSAASLQAILGGLVSLLTLGLMFYLSPVLAVVALVLVVVICLLLFFAARVQLSFQRPIAYLQGHLSALSLQFLNAIGKLRTTHSEGLLFTVWAKAFAKKNQLLFKASLWIIHVTLINNFVLIAGLLIMFALVGSGWVEISFGRFIAFNASYAQFFAATLSLMSMIITFIRLIPQYERIKPVLQTLPEAENRGLELLPFSGELSVKNLSFKFPKESRFILKDVTIEAQPGEMIAIVGPTGSGKSTLIRLLIGFEIPTSGHIEYDQHKLENLNVRVLREQLGVVLQNAILLPGTIFENIQGGQLLSIEQAWDIAAQVGLANFIKGLPMGMETLIAEGAKTFSMGQRQQLLIARALARRPKMIIFDEATSSLDNVAQEKIMHSLEKLKMTRLLVAHRLSSLIHANRIYVLEQGSVVEEGNYKTLLSQQGLFSQLAKKQQLI